MMLRHHPQTVGAPLAQIGLRRQRKNPTHGVVVGAHDNAPLMPWRSDGASTPARASIHNPLCHGSALPPATLAAHRSALRQDPQAGWGEEGWIDLITPSHAFIAARSAAQPRRRSDVCDGCARRAASGRPRRDQNEGWQAQMPCSTSARWSNEKESAALPTCLSCRVQQTSYMSGERTLKYARNVVDLSVGNARARASRRTAGETAERAEMPRFPRKETGGGCRVPQDETSAAMIDVDRLLRGGPLPTLCCNLLRGAVACGR